MSQRKPQAKDIPDAQILAVIPLVTQYSIGANRWAIADFLSFWGFPEKVVLAKLRRLINRGLVDGCACGCRGDFEVL